jgi:alpha-methylacyl-CoA racemase
LFASKTQAEWCHVFDDVDACVTPVLTTDEAISYPHNERKGAFEAVGTERQVPIAAPRLSATPATTSNISPDAGEHSIQVLNVHCGYDVGECQKLIDAGVVEQIKMSRL